MKIRGAAAWLAMTCLALVLGACATGARQQDDLAQAEEQIAPLMAEIARKDAEIERLQYSIEILGRDLEEMRGLVARLQSTVQVTPISHETENLPAQAPQPDSPPAAIAEQPADNGAGSGDFAIHLASYNSPESAAAGWRKLAAAHPDLMSGLEPRYTVLEIAGGPYYRLIAGRFDAREQAAGACKKISPVNGFCIVTFFGGEALP